MEKRHEEKYTYAQPFSTTKLVCVLSYLSNNFSLREGFFFSSTSLLRLEGDDDVTRRNGVYQVFVGRFLLRLDIDNNGWHIRSQENSRVRS